MRTACAYPPSGYRSGAPRRLNRVAAGESEAIAREHVVADHTAAFLCADFGFEGGKLDHYAQLIRRLPESLWRDAIARADSIDHARTAVGYLHTIRAITSSPWACLAVE